MLNKPLLLQSKQKKQVQKTAFQITTFLGLSFFFLLFSQQTKAIGVTPATIELMGIFSTSHVEKEIFISRANPKSTEYISATLSGSGAAAIQIENSEKFELAKGTQNTPFPFSITPQGFAPGDYEALITFQLVKEENSKEQNQILSGSQGKIKFSVLPETDLLIQLEQIGFTELFAQKPLTLTFKALNNTAATASIEKIEFKIIDQISLQTWEEEIVDIIPNSLPTFSDHPYILPTTTSLAQGTYTASVNLFDTQKNLVGSQDFNFTIESVALEETMPINKTGLADTFDWISIFSLVLSFALLGSGLGFWIYKHKK